MMKNILLIVLYKKDIYSSDSIQSFLNIKPLNTDLIIWDNSPEPVINEQISILRDILPSFQYIHTPNNLALSVIYNKVLDSNKDKDLIYLFDDDSSFNSNYFKKNEVAYSCCQDVALFVPIICVDKKIVSPGYFKHFKTFYYKDICPGNKSARNTIVITSGMAIANKRVGNLRFDENLTLYGIDSLFSFEYADRFKNMYIIDYHLEHDLSMFTNVDCKSRIKKLKLYREAYLYIYMKRKYILAYLYCLLYSLVIIAYTKKWSI